MEILGISLVPWRFPGGFLANVWRMSGECLALEMGTSLLGVMPRISIWAFPDIPKCYTQSPLQDSRLFGPRPWKIVATTYEQMGS